MRDGRAGGHGRAARMRTLPWPTDTRRGSGRHTAGARGRSVSVWGSVSTIFLKRGAVIRVVTDIGLLITALLLGLMVRYVWLVNVQNEGTTNADSYIHAFGASVWLLTGICIAVFAASGFYTGGRVYLRSKFLAIAGATTVSYLVFGATSYVFDGQLHFPRAALPTSWGLTIVLLVVARLYFSAVKSVILLEQRHLRMPAHRPIENVLVIGGAGYIGSALVPKLLNQGLRVRVLDLLLYGSEPLAPFITHPSLEIMQADFRQVDRVVEAMRGIDAVIHLGAIVGDPACALDEALTVDINVMATRMIAEVAKGHGVNRFVFASTCSVYGASDEVMDETSPLNPVSLYARSKIACEEILTSMASETFAPIVLRFSTIYGLSGRLRFDLVTNLLTAKAYVDGEITVFGGDQWRPFLHVDDAALALVQTLRAPLTVVRNEVYNVGSDQENFTLMEVGAMIQRLVPSAALLDLGNDGDRRNYRVSFEKIQRDLSFQPRWTVEGGVRQVLDALQNGTVGDYRSALYSNVMFLSEEALPTLMRTDHRWAFDLVGPRTPSVQLSARDHAAAS
jgi:nucleoside-diphosphate-sugar epimerase